MKWKLILFTVALILRSGDGPVHSAQPEQAGHDTAIVRDVVDDQRR